MNNINLMGRLNKIETKTTINGVVYANIVIGVKRKYKNGGDEYDNIRCIAWRNNATFLSNYTSVGDKILIQGELHIDYQTDENGNGRVFTQVVVKEVEIASKNQQNNKQQEQPTYTPVENNDTVVGLDPYIEYDYLDPGAYDDLPF